MADSGKQGRRQPSRLQRRAPASIQISRATDWNVAIPFLSPLITSPTNNLTAEMNRIGTEEAEKREKQPPAMVALKKWQHPAAPFCYEPAPLVPFVRTTAFGGVDRNHRI